MDILKQAVNGRVTLVVPGYSQSQTTLEYEETVLALRQPYLALVKQGLLTFESRHGSKETYRLTTKAMVEAEYKASNAP